MISLERAEVGWVASTPGPVPLSSIITSKKEIPCVMNSKLDNFCLYFRGPISWLLLWLVEGKVVIWDRVRPGCTSDVNC